MLLLLLLMMMMMMFLKSGKQLALKHNPTQVLVLNIQKIKLASVYKVKASADGLWRFLQH